MPRSLRIGLLGLTLLAAVLRSWGLPQRGLWEADEATYTLGGRAYVHLFRARAMAVDRGIDLWDREGMRRIIGEVFPMDYDFRYRFTRGPARVDKVMSGFRTWGKPTFCAAVTLATWTLGPDSGLPALVVSAVAGTLLVGVVGWAAWRLTAGVWAAGAAAAWGATSLTLLHYSRTGYAATLWTLCFATALVSGFRAWRDITADTPLPATALRGALTGALVTVFYGLLPLAGLLAGLEVWWLWRRRAAHTPSGRHAVAWLAGCLAPLLAWQAIGLWREAYLHGALGFPNVYAYFGEVMDQVRSEVEIARRSVGATVRFWAVNALAMEGLVACGLAAAGGAVLFPQVRRRDPAAVAVLGLGACWLAACTLGRFHLGRIYTPVLPLFGLCLGVAVQALATRARLAAGVVVAGLLAYGAWQALPLLTVRSGIPAAAHWIRQHGDPRRVAVTTFGYNQLFRASLDRAVPNPPTRAVLEQVADLYVDVGGLASRFTDATAGVAPAALFPHPVLHFAPARLDLGGVVDPWWRFRLSGSDRDRLAGTSSGPRAGDLIRIYDRASLRGNP